ncbi:transposase [Oceanobacillus halotolerans]|uniref:transposase n=1 Tax=Oceanobacillus halotolerans TaxID=2663380 RepID=UPI0013D9C6A1|nr:transposase [Oceanobacillus halotolerans]
MARKKRIWIPNSFYHVVCRGNRRDTLFKEAEDFNVFLYMLSKIKQDLPFDMASYCLMMNHYHLQIRSTDQPVSKIMARLNKRYADYFNTKNGYTGHVFEKRFHDKLVETKQGMLEVSRYIHLNPIGAGIVKRPEDYQWSSYRYYYYQSPHELLNMEEIMGCFAGNRKEKQIQYEQYVNAEKGTYDKCL